MSFSSLSHSWLRDNATVADAWDLAYLQLQVVLAYADGSLSQAERMTLSLLTLARANERENRDVIEQLVRSIDVRGFDDVARKLAGQLDELSSALPDEHRPAITMDILRGSVAMVVADQILADAERAFLRETVAPALGLATSQVDQVLTDAGARLRLARRYVELAFEVYLFLIDGRDLSPALNAREGQPLSGLLGTVDALVLGQHLVSSRATSYFLGSLGGVFWSDHHERHAADLSALTNHLRELHSTTDVPTRLGAIRAEINEVVHSKKDPNALHMVNRHVVNALAKLGMLDDDQRTLFQEAIAPALSIDVDRLVGLAKDRRSLVELRQNLLAETMGEPDTDRRWWEFWK